MRLTRRRFRLNPHCWLVNTHFMYGASTTLKVRDSGRVLAVTDRPVAPLCIFYPIEFKGIGIAYKIYPGRTSSHKKE